MSGRYQIHDLARALTEEERRTLLDKIKQSLSIDQQKKEHIIHSELRQERRAELIESDIRSLRFWERLRLWFKRLFSNGSDEDVFTQFRLDQAKARVLARNEGYVDFENKVILPLFPEAVRPLAQAILPIRSLFRFLWKDTDSLRRMLDYLISMKIPDAKTALNHFCSTQELLETFRRTESRSQLKQLVLDRIVEYVDRIPPSVMAELEEGLRPLYLLKELAMFDFEGFYVQFQSSEEAAVSTDPVTFHGAAVHRVLEYTELLYLSLYNSIQIKGEPNLYKETLNFYIAYRDAAEGAVPEAPHPDTEEALSLRRSILAAVKKAAALWKELPLADMIRYFSGDPYYRFIAYTPKLRLAEFYYSNLKMEMLQELDRRFNDLRMGVIGRMTQEVFPKGLRQFEYFHPEIQSGIKRAGVGELSVFRTLQIIGTFVRDVSQAGLVEFLRVLGRLIPARGRAAGADMTLYVAGLEDVAERIRDFDQSFSPESDEGKTFYRYRYSASERDSAYLGVYKALVVQKDRDARAIIEKFIDQLRGIRAGLQIVKTGTRAGLNERFRVIVPAGLAGKSFDTVVQDYIQVIDTTEKIVNQMIVVEAET